MAEISGTIDGQDVAGTVGSASLTSEKEATLTISSDYKVAQKRLTRAWSRLGRCCSLRTLLRRRLRRRTLAGVS